MISPIPPIAKKLWEILKTEKKSNKNLFYLVYGENSKNENDYRSLSNEFKEGDILSKYSYDEICKGQ